MSILCFLATCPDYSALRRCLSKADSSVAVEGPSPRGHLGLGVSRWHLGHLEVVSRSTSVHLELDKPRRATYSSYWGLP